MNRRIVNFADGTDYADINAFRRIISTRKRGAVRHHHQHTYANGEVRKDYSKSIRS